MNSWIPENGLRFECTSCGDCCTGPPGYVVYTPDEAEALSRRFGITVKAFEEKYTHDTPVGRSLIENRTEHGYDCVFLDRDTLPGKAICSVYEQRPEQCRTFPWWPEHIQTKAAWERLGRECEGVGRGDFVPLQEITINAQRQADHDGSAKR